MGNQQKDRRTFKLNIPAEKKTADFRLKRSRFMFKPHCKKGLAVLPSPAGMSLTKLSLVSDIPAGDGKMANLFFTVQYDSTVYQQPVLWIRKPI